MGLQRLETFSFSKETTKSDILYKFLNKMSDQT